MPYLIYAVDKPNSAKLRADTRDVHLKYLDDNKNLLLAAGALIDDDGTGGNASVLIVDTDDRAEAEAFAAGDPFAKAGLFQSSTVTRWRKAFFNKENCLK